MSKSGPLCYSLHPGNYNKKYRLSAVLNLYKITVFLKIRGSIFLIKWFNIKLKIIVCLQQLGNPKMNDTTQQYLSELDEQLRFVNLEFEDTIKVSENAVAITLKSIEKLKKFIIKYRFKSQQEEILFFKLVKPQFLSRLIYHNRIYIIETHRPHGGEKAIRKYLNYELDKLKIFFYNNLDFYKYYRTSSEYLDHKYFMRGKHDIKLSIDSFFFETDQRFSTSHDYKVAKIISNDQVQVYLETELAYLENRELRLT